MYPHWCSMSMGMKYVQRARLTYFWRKSSKGRNREAGREERRSGEGRKEEGEVKEEEQWRRISWPHLQWRRKKKSHIEEEDEGLLVCKWWDACRTGRQGCDRWCIAPSRRKEDLTEAVHHYCVSTKNKKSVSVFQKGRSNDMPQRKTRYTHPTVICTMVAHDAPSSCAYHSPTTSKSLLCPCTKFIPISFCQVLVSPLKKYNMSHF